MKNAFTATYGHSVCSDTMYSSSYLLTSLMIIRCLWLIDTYFRWYDGGDGGGGPVSGQNWSWFDRADALW